MSAYAPKHLHKMRPNWLFPYLVKLDQLPGIGTGRWEYWSNILLDAQLPDEPIPQIDFLGQPAYEVTKHISDLLRIAERHGIRHSDAFEAWVVWVLHGLGLPKFRQYESPLDIPDLRRLSAEVLDQWYEQFNLGLLLQHPADYMAHFAQGAENQGYNPFSGAGFFATSMNLCKAMAQMMFSGQGDMRSQTVHDPCCGTGSLLLAASNYSLRLTGQDIMRLMVLCTQLNLYLYAPWGVWWPDFRMVGGPSRQQLEEAIFGKEEPAEQPIPVQLPLLEPVPVAEEISMRESLQTLLRAAQTVEALIAKPKVVLWDDQAVRSKIRRRLEHRAGIAA
jgi:hypothetical protein